MIREMLLKEKSDNITIDYKVWAFIITDGKGNILNQSGNFVRKPIPSEMAIFDGIIDVGRKVEELKNKGITAFGYQLSNSWDK